MYCNYYLIIIESVVDTQSRDFRIEYRKFSRSHQSNYYDHNVYFYYEWYDHDWY